MTAFVKICGENSKQIALNQMTTMGSDPSCQIQISGEGIEERHARIEQKENGTLVLRDLRSATGTTLNNSRILEAILCDGDLIQIGNQEIQFFEKNPEVKTFPLTSRNPVWNEELQSLANVSSTDFPVILLGPSGTGKDVIASTIHAQSLRSKGPFVSVNCSALTESLIESELFGHIKGSFTGAINDRKGAFEAARGGTLFLDEIGDLSYNLQAKLLRAIENSEIRAVGADRNTKTDVRIIAATHQNLAQKIREGVFRSDLYFRLNVVSVSPPALIHRMEDFESLMYTFAKALRVRFSFGAIERLKKHSWPGNIRELKNLVSRAAAFYPKMHVTEELVEKILDKQLLEKSHEKDVSNIPVIKEIEKQMIIKRLEANSGNQRRTASDLGMPKSTLHDRLKYYNIKVSEFKA